MIHYQDNFVYKKVNLEQVIYQYLRDYVEKNSPPEVIAEFRRIFFDFSITDASLKSHIENLIFAKEDRARFSYVLNYCYHIVINHWAQQPELHQFIAELVNIIESVDFKNQYYDRRRNKILELSDNFRRTDYYSKLKRISQVIAHKSLSNFSFQDPISNYLTHYPYLYKFLLLGKEDSPEEKNLIAKLQNTRQKYFEFQLAQHVIYRSRLIEVARARQFSHGAGKLLRRVKNPSLLSEEDLQYSIKKILEKPNKKETSSQIAQKFLGKNQAKISYKEFKKNLYNYLLLGVKPRNKQYKLDKILAEMLDKCYYQSDSQTTNDSLIFQTCRRLLRLMMVDTTKQNNHSQFIDLVINLGTATTVSLLVRMALICPNIKPELEQRLAILFLNYESQKAEDVTWLIKVLENFLIAFSIHFGNIDLSAAKIR